MKERPERLVLVGHPVAHSLSPVMQNAALGAAGIALTYGTVDVLPGDLEATLAQLVRGRAAGNVTVPHKEAAARSCARVTAVAQRAGAVNTFWVEDGALVGDNTDVAGFHNAVVRLSGRVPSHARIAVLGAGGAAAAVLTAIAEWPGCEVRVWNRTPDRVQALLARFPGVAVAVPTIAEAVADAALVVNATTIGMSDDERSLRSCAAATRLRRDRPRVPARRDRVGPSGADARPSCVRWAHDACRTGGASLRAVVRRPGGPGRNVECGSARQREVEQVTAQLRRQTRAREEGGALQFQGPSPLSFPLSPLYRRASAG